MKGHPAESDIFACIRPLQSMRVRVAARDAIRMLVGALMWAYMTASAAQSANELFRRAFELLRQGEAPVAIEMFRMGLALDPDNGLARLYLGTALEQREPPDEAGAEAEYRRASELLKGRAEGAEAASRAQKLADKRSRANLLVNKTLLDGKWCFKTATYSGYYMIKGGHVDIVETNGRNTATLEVIGESQFKISVRSFFTTYVYVSEIVDANSFRDVSVNGAPSTDTSLTRRCN